MDHKISLYLKCIILLMNGVDICLLFNLNDYFEKNKIKLLGKNDIIELLYFYISYTDRSIHKYRYLIYH